MVDPGVMVRPGLDGGRAGSEPGCFGVLRRAGEPGIAGGTEAARAAGLAWASPGGDGGQGAEHLSAATIRHDFDEPASQQMLTRSAAVPWLGRQSTTCCYATQIERYPSEKEYQSADGQPWSGAKPGRGLLNGEPRDDRGGEALATRSDLGIGGPVPPRVTVVTNALNIATGTGHQAAHQDRDHRRGGPAAVLRAHRAAGHRRAGAGHAGRGLPGRGRDRRGGRGDRAPRGRGEHQPADGAAGPPGDHRGGQLQGGAARLHARICTPAEIDVLVTDAGIAAEDARPGCRTPGSTLSRY